MNRAYSRALSYLTARSRTVRETTEYLIRKGFSASEIHEAVARLLEIDLLNDMRTAREWVDYCLSCKPRGRDRLMMELSRRGIDREIILETLADVDDSTEYAQALQLLAPRPVNTWPRDKLFRFLRYRGFSYSVIERIYTHYENLT